MQSLSEWPRLTEYQVSLKQFITFFRMNHPDLKTNSSSELFHFDHLFSSPDTQRQQSQQDETSVSKRGGYTEFGQSSPIKSRLSRSNIQPQNQDIDFIKSALELNQNNLKATQNLTSLQGRCSKKDSTTNQVQYCSKKSIQEESKFQSTNIEDYSISKFSFLRVSTKNNLQQLIRLVISYHNINEQKIRQLRIQVEKESPNLLVIFDQLIFKYDNISKSKEEVIKFIIRKTVKQIKQERTKNRIQSQQCEVYKILDGQNDGSLDSYKSFKSINQSLLKTLFNSDIFVERYNQLLTHLPQLIDDDNEKKISRLTIQVVSLLKKKQAPKNYFKQVKRLPWTERNKDYAVRIASELLEQGKPKM